MIPMVFVLAITGCDIDPRNGFDGPRGYHIRTTTPLLLDSYTIEGHHMIFDIRTNRALKQPPINQFTQFDNTGNILVKDITTNGSHHSRSFYFKDSQKKAITYHWSSGQMACKDYDVRHVINCGKGFVTLWSEKGDEEYKIDSYKIVKKDRIYIENYMYNTYGPTRKQENEKYYDKVNVIVNNYFQDKLINYENLKKD